MKRAISAPPPTERDNAIEPGSTIGQFRVERVIATRPGVDTVLEATTANGSRVAVTVLGESFGAEPERLRATLKLVRIRASLKHPHLLPLRGPRRGHGRAFYVVPIASVTTLAERLRAGPLAPADALRVATQIASALELAASRGLIHRDLTPAAVQLKRGGPIHALLGDFAVTSPSAAGCELLAATGSVDYRSPEELRGAPARARSNVYSLTCILLECLTGQRPYRHDRPLLTLHAHLVEPPPRVSEREGRLPAALDAVIAKGMAKDPAERFRSPTQLVEAAGQALDATARAPAVAPHPKQAERERVVVRERRRPTRDATRRERTKRRPRRLRPARISAWAGLALAVSAVSGFATGTADWSADPDKPSATAPAESRIAREQRIDYVNTVSRAVDRLGKRRAKARHQLRDARRPATQVDAAKKLSHAYRHARRALPAAPPERISDARLGSALRRTERAYDGLAVAARDGDDKAWQAARREAERGDRRIARALRSLRAG